MRDVVRWLDRQEQEAVRAALCRDAGVLSAVDDAMGTFGVPRDHFQRPHDFGDLARLVGSWTFVVLQAVLSLCWLVLNVVAATQHWDPYPFLLLNLVLSLESALWTALVLMMLNLAGDRERLRAQQEYEVAVKAEEEMRAVMAHLEAQDEVLLQVLQRLDRSDRAVRRLGHRLGIPEDASG